MRSVGDWGGAVVSKGGGGGARCCAGGVSPPKTTDDGPPPKLRPSCLLEGDQFSLPPGPAVTGGDVPSAPVAESPRKGSGERSNDAEKRRVDPEWPLRDEGARESINPFFCSMRLRRLSAYCFARALAWRACSLLIRVLCTTADHCFQVLLAGRYNELRGLGAPAKARSCGSGGVQRHQARGASLAPAVHRLELYLHRVRCCRG